MPHAMLATPPTSPLVIDGMRPVGFAHAHVALPLTGADHTQVDATANTAPAMAFFNTFPISTSLVVAPAKALTLERRLCTPHTKSCKFLSAKRSSANY
jgi:hypothetical protein